MASENKDGENNLPTTKSTSEPTTKVHDLDRNPIKFATSEPGKFTTEAHDKAYMELTLRSSDKHSETMQKILRQRIELRAKEFPRWPASASGGVRIMWAESRFWYDRERLKPDFDDDWRSYRARYLHSLELDPREPVHVPEYETTLINPIRRFYMKGGDWFENNIVRKFTQDKYKSAMYRVVVTRGIMLYFAAIGVYYWARFNHTDWERGNRGLVIEKPQPIIWPSHPKFPFKDYKTLPAHHYDQGFLKRKVFTDLNDFEDTTVVI